MEYRKLGELVELKQGMAINAKSNHFVSKEETSLALLRIADMSTKSRVVFMSEDTPERFIASKDDIIYTRTGQVGLVFREQQGVVHNNCFRIIPNDENKLDKSYLYWYLSLNSIRNFANSIASGSAQPDLPHTTFKKIKIWFPEIDIQRKLASTLDQYEFAIENNNKRIRLLEQMAENLYKEWFVRFRFPGYENVEFKDSPLGKIPTIFDVVKIGTLIDYYIGGGWGEEEASEQFSQGAFVVRGTDFPNVRYGVLNSCPLRYHKPSNYEKRKFEVNDIAFEVSGGTQEQPVGRSIMITKRQLGRFNNKLICASFCKQIRCNPQKINPRYLYHWLQYMYNTRMIDQFQLQSTGIINFKFEYFLRKGNVLMPPPNLMDDFTTRVEQFYEEIDILSEQNAKLVAQRDYLLPRLMSGKLEV